MNKNDFHTDYADELAQVHKYTVTDLRNAIDMDRHAVRDEVLRRHALAVHRLELSQRETARRLKVVQDLDALAKECL